MLQYAVNTTQRKPWTGTRCKVATFCKATSTRYYFSDFTLDIRHYTLYQGTQEIPITSGLFDLLLAFILHPQEILNRDTLLNLTHNKHADPYDRSIDIGITRLRRLLNDRQHQLIKTIRHKGYYFTAEVIND